MLENCLDRKQAAEYLGVTIQTLANWAVKNRLKHFLYNKKAYYHKDELDDFIVRSMFIHPKFKEAK